MLKTLEEKFQSLERDGRIQIDDADFTILTKTYRLKHFHKCPICDSNLKNTQDFNDSIEFHWNMECSNCSWKKELKESDLSVLGLNSILLKICREGEQNDLCNQRRSSKEVHLLV